MKKRSIVHVHVRCNFRDLCYPRFIIDSLSTLRPFAPHFHVNDRNLRLSIGKYIFISRIIVYPMQFHRGKIRVNLTDQTTIDGIMEEDHSTII